MNDSKQSTIGVIGAGTMGIGIAQVAARFNHEVLIYDSNAGALEKSLDGLKRTLESQVSRGKMVKEVADLLLKKVRPANGLSEFSSCSLVIEAIIEDLKIKQHLFAETEAVVSETTILASNTSSLSITSIASACKKPDRVLGIHFFNPAPLMPLVEIIPGLATSAEFIKSASSIISAMEKSVVVAKDTPGFIVNRVARPFYGESIRIHEEGWNGISGGEIGYATIDWAMKEIGGFRMGPFELMDLIGNDINYTVTETVWQQFYFDPKYKPSLTQKRLTEAKRFGRKSGQGYYSYAEGASKPEPVQDKKSGEQILQRVLAMLINEAVEALYLNIATRDDIDLAMTKGVNYPKGLLKWCDEIGADKILQTLLDLKEYYGEERYRPSALLKKMVKEKKKFYE